MLHERAGIEPLLLFWPLKKKKKKGGGQYEDTSKKLAYRLHLQNFDKYAQWLQRERINVVLILCNNVSTKNKRDHRTLSDI